MAVGENWVQLTSGGGYSFDAEAIFGRYSMEKDLAYPLAGINRFVSHSQVRWTVAIHSVAVARLIEKMTGDLNQAAAGLLHDAHESIVGDIPTPLAKVLGYDKVGLVKDNAQRAIHTMLNIPTTCMPVVYPAIVRMADLTALYVEKQLFMVPEPQSWALPEADPMWMQAMYDIMLAIIRDGENGDGGEQTFCDEFRRLISDRTPDCASSR